MHQIENEINFKLEEKLSRYKWMDYTDQINTSNEGDQKYYLVILKKKLILQYEQLLFLKKHGQTSLSE